MAKIVKTIKKYKYLLLTILFILVAFLIFGLNSFHENVWYDEAYQMILNRYSLPEIISLVSRDNSGPLYAVSLKLVTSIFGNKVYVARMLSLVIFSVQFILAFYPIRRLYNGKVSFFMSIILLLSSVSAYASIEIRIYSIAMTCTLGAIVYSILYLRDKNKGDLIKYFIFALCALYTHNYAMVSVCSVLLISTIYSLFIKRDKKMILTNILLFLCYLPWFIVLIRQYLRVTNGYWISKASFLLIVQVFKNLLTDNTLINIILFLLMIISILISFREKRELKSILYYIIPTIGIILLTYFWSAFFTPIFMPRYIVPLCGVLYLMISKIICNNKNIVIPVIFVILLIPNFWENYKLERKLTEDYQIKEIIQLIDNLPKESFAFYDINEFDLGLVEYYFPNYKHYVDPNMDYILTTPEVYGDVTKENNMTEKLIVAVTPYDVQDVFYIDALVRKGYLMIADYRYYIPYNGGFNIYLYEKS